MGHGRTERPHLTSTKNGVYLSTVFKHFQTPHKQRQGVFEALTAFLSICLSIVYFTKSINVIVTTGHRRRECESTYGGRSGGLQVLPLTLQVNKRHLTTHDNLKRREMEGGGGGEGREVKEGSSNGRQVPITHP